MEKTEGMTPLSAQEDLLPPVREYLSGFETIDNISVKAARSAVAEKLGRPVDKKAFKAALMTVLDERKDEEEEASSSPSSAEEAPRKKGLAQSKAVLSKPLSALLGVERETRPQVVKKLWEYIRSKGLQNPEDKREIICDATLKEIFKRDTVTMFSMNKLLSCHIISQKAWDEGTREFDFSKLEEDDAPPRQRAAKKRTPLKRKRQGGGGGGGGFAKLQRISDDLQSFMGSEQAARTDVIKKLWEHIRANELQNPDNKREVLCDDTLKGLLGQDKVTIFSMNKYIQPHFIKDDE